MLVVVVVESRGKWGRGINPNLEPAFARGFGEASRR